MSSAFNFQLLYPISLLVIQTYILMFATLFILRRSKLLRTPLIDNEASQMIVSGSILFSVLYISSANFDPLLQAFKIFRSQQVNLYSSTFYRFGQYFLDVFGAAIVFGLLTLLNVKLFLGPGNVFSEVKEGNIPMSILISAITISFATLAQFLTSEVISYLTPKVVIFN